MKKSNTICISLLLILVAALVIYTLNSRTKTSSKIVIEVTPYDIKNFERFIASKPDILSNTKIHPHPDYSRWWTIEVASNFGEATNPELQELYDYLMAWGEASADRHFTDHWKNTDLLISYGGSISLIEVIPPDAIVRKYN
jgi:hypothetical protein